MAHRNIQISDSRNPRPSSRAAFCLALLLSGVCATGLRADAQAQSPQSPQSQAPLSQGPQSRVRAVRLSDVEGSVQILRGDQTQFEQAFPNMPVLEGSRLQTGEDGRVEIQFEDGAVARLTPNSSLNLDQLSRNANGTTANQLEVLSGLVYFELGADRHQQYSVLFGGNVITPDAASTFRVNLDPNPGEVVVLQGAVHASSASASAVKVREGETIRFDSADARYFLSQGAEPDSWDQWNLDRDHALASMDSQQTNVAGVDQSGPGWSDLDHYGDWYSVPDYGNVWAPRGVDASWDPYGSGYWAYYPGYGYMWISSNPWGWLPYHCGAWNYFGGFGWGWIPNSCGGWGGGGFAMFDDLSIWNTPSYYSLPQRPHPVGPRDNLPRHGGSNGGFGGGGGVGKIIVVNRGGGSGAGTGAVGTGFLDGSPRVFHVAGKVVNPLPKTVYPERQIEVAGPRSVVHAPPAGTDMRPRPMAPQYGGAPSYGGQPGGRYGTEQAPRPPFRSSPDAGAPRSGSAPVYSAPRSAPPVYEAPRSAPPVYQAPRSAPPSYSPPPAPRASAPSESHSSSPAPSSSGGSKK